MDPRCLGALQDRPYPTSGPLVSAHPIKSFSRKGTGPTPGERQGKMSENIIAKFKCESVTKTHTGNKDEQGNLLQNETVNLSVVTSGKANVGWSRYTPWGKLEMAITNPGAQDKIKPGKNYKITIEEVSEDF